MAAFLLSTLALAAGVVNAQVTATGTNGVTNPAQPTHGSYNQTSYARLLSLDAYDDFCLFGPPTAGADSLIGNTEALEVAWCTKPRNNARLIPDGTFYAIHFVKTPLYVQIQGWGDFTKLNIPYGDEGGELDPHGATGDGNPVGGNVTSNVSGSDVFYGEWMNYMAYNQFCLRICTAENSTYSAAIECQHTFDLMGCEWVMPGDYTNGTFTSCDADAAYPPGVYPIGSAGSGTTSTFAQRYTNTVVGNEFTIGVTVTPSSAYSLPASSNCVTHTSPSNGVTDILTAATVSTQAASSSTTAAASGASSTGSASGSRSTSGTAARTGASASAAASTAAASASSSAKSAGMASAPFTSSTLIGAAFSFVALALGGAAVML